MVSAPEPGKQITNLYVELVRPLGATNTARPEQTKLKTLNQHAEVARPAATNTPQPKQERFRTPTTKTETTYP